MILIHFKRVTIRGTIKCTQILLQEVKKKRRNIICTCICLFYDTFNMLHVDQWVLNF